MTTATIPCLPDDAGRAMLVGRVWRLGEHAGPSVVAVRDGAMFDISAAAPTMRADVVAMFVTPRSRC